MQAHGRTSLGSFDAELSMRLAGDTSAYGGSLSTLCHIRRSEQPIAFASRTLSLLPSGEGSSFSCLWCSQVSSVLL